MDVLVLIFLSSGLFLGWSLGSNDAANVFGTAVGSRMVRFGTAALLTAIFACLGAVISGEGAAEGLGKLGAVNALPGAFTVALSAAVTVYAMSKLGLPVSTTQAIVGAIVGWNFFSGSPTDLSALSRIVGTWVAGPILGAIFAIILYKLTALALRWAKIHLVWLDMWTRIGLVLAGVFGAYSLGANNIANVMGVFMPSSPFADLDVGGLFTLSSIHQLFLLGGLAIGVGAFYSKRVMMTVGQSIMPVSSIGAWVAVVAHSMVLFTFSSTSLRDFVVGLGLPAIPLVPVSSSQAVVGAVIGIGLTHGIKGARQIRWGVLANIASGWVSTPIISAVICFVLLFVVQNVFQQPVYEPVHYQLTSAAMERLAERGVDVAPLEDLRDVEMPSAARFRTALRQRVELPADQEHLVMETSRLTPVRFDLGRFDRVDDTVLSQERLAELDGRECDHAWQVEEVLMERASARGGGVESLGLALDHLIEIFGQPIEPPRNRITPRGGSP